MCEGNRFIGWITKAKGKSKPEKIFTLVGGKELLSQEIFSQLAQVQSEYLQAYRAQDWLNARAAIKKCRPLAEGLKLDGLYDVYEARLANFEKNPPPADWQGVYDALNK